MTLPAHFWRRFPRRVVEIHGQEPWLPDETPFCTYSERHQIMRENYRYSMASKLFYDVLRDCFDGDLAALARALEELCKDLDESLYNSRTNLLVFENETLEVSDDDDEL